MQRSILLVCIAALLLGKELAYAEIIDRIAVVVGDGVITESEIVRQARITGFINGSEQEPDLSLDARRQVADRLIEQALIRKELDTARFAPPLEAAKKLEAQIRERFPTSDAYQAALRKANLTEEEIRESTQWQATLLEFISSRFRPAIQISDAEVNEYYDREVKPKAGEAKPPLADLRPEIEEILTEQRVDNALDRWLGNARTQTRILYRLEPNTPEQQP